MPLRFRLIAVLLSCVCAASQAGAANGKATLDDWMDSTLIPSVVSQLRSHPRFQQQIVRFVVMHDGRPAAITNELALALRDRLQDAVLDQSGIRVGWQIDRQHFNRLNEQSQVDCTTSEVHYYIGLELEALRSGRFTVSVRALDVAEQSWVSGFGEFWQGTLTTLQHRAYRQAESDQSYLGQRTVPFAATQTDLLAAQLAHNLGCSLLRQMSGEYVAALSGSSDASADTLALIGNNLAAYHALQILPDDAAINSIIEAKAHRIDNDLYQYWVTITPLQTDAALPTISASAYIYLADVFLPVAMAEITPNGDLPAASKLISTLEIVRLSNTSLCDATRTHGNYVVGRPASATHCFALQAQTQQDSVAFFLYHQLNNGLVRLGDRNCSQRTDARIARHGQLIHFPLPIDTSESASWLPGEGLEFSPNADTFYLVASSNTKAARALARHFEELPQRCGYAVRPGLEGQELRRWFRKFDAIATRWQAEIDWQSLRVRNVF